MSARRYNTQTRKSFKIRENCLSFGEKKETLIKFARLIAKLIYQKNPIKPIKGLRCSYYWNGNYIDEKILNEELDAIEGIPQKLNIDYIQIDAGFSKNWGDWLDYKDRFPSGMQHIVKRINKMGYKAGIWLAPFLANPWSNIFKRNPDWFLKNDEGQYFETGPAAIITRITKNVALSFRSFDLTKQKFRQHLKNIIRHFTELGFELIKLDFLYPVCFSTNYSSPLTRTQALRSRLELIKETAGNNIHIVSAITPLSPLVGLVDSARMGLDTLNPYICNVPLLNFLVNNKTLESNFKNNTIRKFLNGIVWTNVVDCLVFRDGTGIKKTLIKKQKKFAKQNNMSLWIGDSIARLNYKNKNNLLRYFSRP